MYPRIYRMARSFWPGGLETRQHLRELEHTQWLSRTELEAWQLDRLINLLKHAYEHVPYYRERYQREDIHPEDIKSFEDFQALPILTRDDINENRDKMVASNLRDQVQSDETGGSTGEPMHFFIEDSFWWWNAALEFRGRSWYGVHEGDKIAWVWGDQRDMPDWTWQKRLKFQIMQQRFLNAFALTEAKMKSFATMLVDWQPAMFRGYASALTLFARYIKDQGITGIRPRLIETTAEKVTTPQRELLEEVFHCPVADCYSGREFATIAYQCEKGGLHVCETRHLEVVANGQVVPAGQMGEVVVTSLTQLAMPLIRYKNGDMAIYETSNCCCGRGLPLLREVVGRMHDYLATADGQFVHGEFFAYTFRVKPEVERYQIYQPDLHHLHIRLVCNQPVSQAWLDNARAEVQARFGQATQITLEIVDRIELTPAGKHRFIISEVKPNFDPS